MTEEDKKRDLENNLEEFRKLSENINVQITPITQFSEELQRKMQVAFEPMRQMVEIFQQWNEITFEKLKSTLGVIRNIQENHKEGKEIRGEIITSVIDLDGLLEAIILKKYVKESLYEEFASNMLNDELCSSFLKYKVVARSGLLDKYKELKNNIITLLEIRNIIAHSRYRPTVQTVEILHKNQIKDIRSLKKEFDSIFEVTMEKLQEVI